jgi:hypothetical protein
VNTADVANHAGDGADGRGFQKVMPLKPATPHLLPSEFLAQEFKTYSPSPSRGEGQGATSKAHPYRRSRAGSFTGRVVERGTGKPLATEVDKSVVRN